MGKKRKIKINVIEEKPVIPGETGDRAPDSQTEEHRLSAEQEPRKAGFLRSILRFAAYGLVFLVVAFAFFSIFTEKNIISENKPNSWLNKISIVSQFKNLVESSDKKLKGEENDRINILLLGMGGKKHSGGYLTDTIMLVSLQPSTKKVGLLSIPRDLTVPIEGVNGWRKINNINALAEQNEPGSGGQAVIQAIGDILNIPIDYYVRVDFEGFIKVVDELGGVDVNVENTLDDYSYPVMGREQAYPYSSRYEHLHIEKGFQHMDGELALKFARSRHALGAEGSDFARAKRQQKIIEAVKEKGLSFNMLFKPLKIKNIIEALNEHVSTNLEVWEMVRVWDQFKDVDKERVVNKVLDNSPGGLLRSTVGDGGAYILVPKSGDFSEIQYLALNLLNEAPSEVKTEVINEQVNVEVQNGTWINGLASKISVDLEKYGFNITEVGNASRKNFQKSVIYDLTYGKKMNSLQILKQKSSANVSFGLPTWLEDDVKAKEAGDQKYSRPDFLLILGQDALNLPSAN